MSDAAFKTAPYPAYTTKDLIEFLAQNKTLSEETRGIMQREISRRIQVQAGDTSVMTPGERLRHIRKQEKK